MSQMSTRSNSNSTSNLFKTIKKSRFIYRWGDWYAEKDVNNNQSKCIVLLDSLPKNTISSKSRASDKKVGRIIKTKERNSSENIS